MTPPLVAFMGLTGSGKSSLINLLLGENKAKVGHGMKSETSEIQSYKLRYNGREIILVDTPGFDDTYKSNSDILRTLYNWLKTNYSNGQKLTAVFYLHNIADKRMRGSSLTNLYAFKRICGEDFFSNVLLGLTFWRTIRSDEVQAASTREAELKSTDDFWKQMIAGGARVCRMPDVKADVLSLLMPMASKTPKVLQLQAEAVEQNRSFESISAQEALDGGLAAAQEQHAMEKARLAAEAEKARKAREQEAARVAREAKERREQEQRETERREQAAREAAEAHRQRMVALREQQERAEARERELQQAMQRMKISSARRQKLEKFKRRVASLMYLVNNSPVTPGIIVPLHSTYNGICDNCFETIGFSSFYRCSMCNNGEFDLCLSCHAATGVYCDDASHFSSMQKIEYQGYSSCPRRNRPTKSYDYINCDSCGRKCEEVYFHCCQCRSDDFDLCVDCALREKHAGCRHRYNLCARYIQ